MSYYLKLFHGRKDPAKDMNDWGEDGPYIGPFSAVTWTYGDLKLHDKDGNNFAELSTKMDGDMILFDGMWYGDFELRYITGLEEANEMKDAVSFWSFFRKEVFTEKEGA